MCRWCPPQRTQWYSVRSMKSLRSVVVANAPGIVVKKLGHPVPLSNFIAEVKSGRPQPAHANTPGRFSRSSGLVPALGALVTQHVVGRGRQAFFPLGVRELGRFGARGHVRSFGEQGCPVLLQVFHFHGSFRGSLSPSCGTETRQGQCRQTSQPVATIHFFTSVGRPV